MVYIVTWVLVMYLSVNVVIGIILTTVDTTGSIYREAWLVGYSSEGKKPNRDSEIPYNTLSTLH